MVPARALLKLDMPSSSRKSIRWVFDCSRWQITSNDWFKCLKAIQREERDRIGRFVFRNDAMSSMAAQLLMRKCLVETGRRSWKDLRVVRSERGKPHAPDSGHVVFSVSHHGRLTVLAAEILETKDGTTVCDSQSASEDDHHKNQTPSHSPTSKNVSDDLLSPPLTSLTIENRNKPILDNPTCKLKTNPDKVAASTTVPITEVAAIQFSNTEVTFNSTVPSLGVDICNQELPRNTAVPNFFRLMQRHFHQDEWDYILAARSESAQLGRFYRMWALKESYVKATGTGLDVSSMSEICFHVASELDCGQAVYDTRLVHRGRNATEWTFEETRLRESYCVAVAMSNAAPADVSGEKTYEEVAFSDVEGLMEELEVEDEEELFFASRDFVKKQLRPWDR